MAVLGLLRETLGVLPALAGFGKMLKQPNSTPDCLARQLEQTSSRYPDQVAIVFEGRELTWRGFNALTNRYAHGLKALGVVKGDVVSIMMENRPEFLAVIVALNKLGAVASLLNNNLIGKPLAHCVSVANSVKVVVGEECIAPMGAVCDQLGLTKGDDYLYLADAGEASTPSWAQDFGALCQNQSKDNPPDTLSNTWADPALYIFTSGTTGLPKAAIMSNRRYLIGATTSAKLGLRCDRFDRIYLCLPLYHATGLMLGVGAALVSGASMFLRRRFSASRFLTEVRDNDVTCFMYIGELCRYLMHQPAQDDDWRSPLTKVMGNGLRPDVWLDFKKRFGIARIMEFYGSSEGNVAFANVFNKNCTVGTTSVEVALVRYDVDEDIIVRDERGYCVEVAPGEPGLLLGKITEHTEFEGYTDPKATEDKILRNALQDGDAWFNTGDMLKTVDVGFALGQTHYQFVDRVGDTFRWKAENVSTNEVGELLNAHPQLALCNVYGVEVPGADGRAGMAAVALAEGETALDIDSFSAHVCEQLPSYARPVFIRVLPTMDTTGTFKMVKTHLRKEGYDPNQVDDVLYVLKPGAEVYERLDTDFAQQLANGTAGY